METIPLKAVISYPFSGALYAFFEEQLNEYRTHPPTPHENHPYYRTLFGDQFPRFQELALTLTLLFDEVILVPADAKMPADKEFVNDEIRHQGLGLVSSWDFEARRSFEEPVTEDLEDAVIRKVLRRVPTSSRRQILENTRHEILLAARHSCPIVCFGGRRALIERILTREAEHIEIYDPASLSFAEEYLDLVGHHLQSPRFRRPL